jgi:hypothetical protein
LSTNTATGTYKLDVSAASLGIPPAGTTYLQVALNPNGSPPESNSNDNTGALAAGPTAILANSLHYSIVGTRIHIYFMPAEGDTHRAPSAPPVGALTLPQAAAILGVDHFNWIQTFISPPYIRYYHNSVSPSNLMPEPFLDPPVLNAALGINNYHDIIEWSAIAHTGELDHGHATRIDLLPLDPWPFYWDEPLEVKTYELPTTSVSPAELEFTDDPEAPAGFLRPGDYDTYTTKLAGVSDTYTEIPLPLTEQISWNSNNPGTPGHPARVWLNP